MREARRDSRGLLAAVAASVALHAAALFLICGAPPRLVEPPPELVDFDFVVSQEPQLAPPSEPAQRPQVPMRRGGTKVRRTDRVVPPAPDDRSTDAESSTSGSDAPVAKSEEPQVLVPSPSF